MPSIVGLVVFLYGYLTIDTSENTAWVRSDQQSNLDKSIKLLRNLLTSVSPLRAWLHKREKDNKINLLSINL